jgi:hypothetical protein
MAMFGSFTKGNPPETPVSFKQNEETLKNVVGRGFRSGMIQTDGAKTQKEFLATRRSFFEQMEKTAFECHALE